jgi:hypothetical protein
MTSLVMASLLLLGGCTAVKVKLGMKVYLESIPITSIEASLPKAPGIAPGEKFPLVVIVTELTARSYRQRGRSRARCCGKILRLPLRP